MKSILLEDVYLNEIAFNTHKLNQGDELNSGDYEHEGCITVAEDSAISQWLEAFIYEWKAKTKWCNYRGQKVVYLPIHKVKLFFSHFLNVAKGTSVSGEGLPTNAINEMLFFTGEDKETVIAVWPRNRMINVFSKIR